MLRDYAVNDDRRRAAAAFLSPAVSNLEAIRRSINLQLFPSNVRWISDGIAPTLLTGLVSNGM